VKELSALAVMLMGELVAPAARVREVGETMREKSDAGADMVAVTLAVWVTMPEVPVKVRVALPMVAVGAAVMLMVCAVPGVRVKVAGFAATPEGRPVMETATVPVKELSALAVMLMDEPPAPATSVNEVGEAVREKSGGGAEMVAATVAV